METMHAAGRRTLPPVPRSGVERANLADVPTESTTGGSIGGGQPDSPTERFVVDLSTGDQRPVCHGKDEAAAEATDEATAEATAESTDESTAEAAAEDLAMPAGERRAGVSAVQAPAGDPRGSGEPELDPAQQFVAQLRAAAADFAEAAGAGSAVVREAVPPARHRRARCRVMLRYADEREADVTFLGPAGSTAAPSRHGFDRQIRRWLAAGQRRDDAWLVPDPEAPDGMAIDLSAWVRAA